MNEEVARRLRLKRFNELVKLFVTTVNAIALVIFGAGVLQPLVVQSSSIDWSWVAISAILHLWAQVVIRLLQPE